MKKKKLKKKELIALIVGAPVEHSYNYKCPYCNTFLYNTDERIQKINNVEIRDVKISTIMDPLTYSYIFSIMGFTVPKANYYKESYNTNLADVNVFSIDDIKKVRYNIKISIDDVRTKRAEEIIDILLKSLPPLFKNSEEVVEELIRIVFEAKK